MIPGFEKIVEERIRKAQLQGDFDHLEGYGKPLKEDDGGAVAEDLRLAYKILKNADCLPVELELKKEIAKTEDLLNSVEDVADRYNILKKLNFLIMKVNLHRNSKIAFEMPQQYEHQIVERVQKKTVNKQP